MNDREILTHIINQQARIDELEALVLEIAPPIAPPESAENSPQYVTCVNGVDVTVNMVRFLISRIAFYKSIDQRGIKISLIKDMQNEFILGLKASKDIVEALTGCDLYELRT